MTFVFEVSRPFQKTPGCFESRLIVRFWWLWFAVSVLRVPFEEYSTTEKVWIK